MAKEVGKHGEIKFKDGWVAPSGQDHMILMNGMSWYMTDEDLAEFIEALQFSREKYAEYSKKLQSIGVDPNDTNIVNRTK